LEDYRYEYNPNPRPNEKFSPSCDEVLKWLRLVGAPPLFTPEATAGVHCSVAYELGRRWRLMGSNDAARGELSALTKEQCIEQQKAWEAAADRLKKESAPAAAADGDADDGAMEALFVAIAAEEDDEDGAGSGEVTKGGKEVPGEFLKLSELTPAQRAAINCPGAHMIGVDPGVRSLISAVEVRAWLLQDRKTDLPSGRNKAPTPTQKRLPATWFQYTKVQRQFESRQKFLRNEREKIIAKALKGGVDVKGAEAHLKDLNSASMDVEELKTYIRVRQEVAATVRPVYEKPAFRRFRFVALRYRDRSEASMVKAFEATFGVGKAAVTTIFWGNWSANHNSSLRGSPPTATIRLCRLFARYGYTIVWVDEAYTSKHCHGCEKGVLSTFRKVPHPKPGHEGEERVCWGLTRCDYCGRMWNRDHNAALNILWVAVQVRACSHAVLMCSCLTAATCASQTAATS